AVVAAAEGDALPVTMAPATTTAALPSTSAYLTCRSRDRTVMANLPFATRSQLRIHCWLLPPLQVHSSICVPFAVPAPVASRHRPDWTPVMEPSALTDHCWLAPPSQVQMSTLVPGLVP